MRANLFKFFRANLIVDSPANLHIVKAPSTKKKTAKDVKKSKASKQMRLITIGLGACALYALSVAQAENAPAAGDTASAEGLKIDPFAYPSLKELEARISIFNAFAAKSGGNPATDAQAQAASPEIQHAKGEHKQNVPAKEAKMAPKPKKEPKLIKQASKAIKQASKAVKQEPKAVKKETKDIKKAKAPKKAAFKAAKAKPNHKKVKSAHKVKSHKKVKVHIKKHAKKVQHQGKKAQHKGKKAQHQSKKLLHNGKKAHHDGKKMHQQHQFNAADATKHPHSRHTKIRQHKKQEDHSHHQFQAENSHRKHPKCNHPKCNHPKCKHHKCNHHKCKHNHGDDDQSDIHGIAAVPNPNQPTVTAIPNAGPPALTPATHPELTNPPAADPEDEDEDEDDDDDKDDDEDDNQSDIHGIAAIP
ncbi:hypothetical protein BG003_008969, partial [Podila horticola]